MKESIHDTIGNSSGGSKLPANPTAKVLTVPPSMTSKDNEGDNDEKSLPVPASLTFTNTSDCLSEEACISSSFAGGRDGTYWSSPVKGKRTRNQPELLNSPKKQ